MSTMIILDRKNWHRTFPAFILNGRLLFGVNACTGELRGFDFTTDNPAPASRVRQVTITFADGNKIRFVPKYAEGIEQRDPLKHSYRDRVKGRPRTIHVYFSDGPVESWEKCEECGGEGTWPYIRFPRMWTDSNRERYVKQVTCHQCWGAGGTWVEKPMPLYFWRKWVEPA